MVVLFAALIAPFFINWNSYRSDFEREASRILGHPVHVGGASHVSILPSPSLTFTDVEVGDPGADPLMTIAQFSATFELVPLFQGQVHVVSMRLENPVVRVTAAADGTIDWMQRAANGAAVDPDKVALADVRIDGGSLIYRDAGTGVSLAFDSIDANISATSLAGPWRIDGTYRKDGAAVPFRLASGRRLDNGTLRVQAEVSPAELPVAVTTDGVLADSDASGITYTGTYSVASAANVPAQASDASSGSSDNGGDTSSPAPQWRSDGSFTLSRANLVIDKAVLSEGAADRATSIAGSLTVGFGSDARFDATATASQLDLDTALGGGPTAPINVADAGRNFAGWVTSLPAPPIPGKISLNVPAVIVGGSVMQNVDFTVEPGAAGWKVDDLRADLPGRGHVEANGVIAGGKSVGFAGTARLAVADPAAFAAWWRGATAGLQRTLPPFDISASADIAEGRASLDDIAAKIGDASISGRLAWTVSGRDHTRHLGTDLKADRIDLDEVRQLAALITGRDVADTRDLADSYSIRLAADEFAYGDTTLKGVAVDAEYSADVLNIVQFAVGDLGGGASFRVTSGHIEGITTDPRGHLTARLDAPSLDGVAALSERLLPGSSLSAWLAREAPLLAPAGLDLKITGPPKPGTSGFEVAVNGALGQTSLNATVDTAAATLSDWPTANASFNVVLDSPDSAALAAQLGLAARATANDSGTHLAIAGSGSPGTGMDTTVDTDVAGLAVSGKGKLTLGDALAPNFAGTFDAHADDVGPPLALCGMTVPGASGSPLTLAGTVKVSGASAAFTWQNGSIAGNTVSGTLALARGNDAVWRADGDLSVDSADLGWLAALGLGTAPLPTGDPKMPWPKVAFTSPTTGALSGKVTAAVNRLTVGDLNVTGSTVSLALSPQRIDIDLKRGGLAGGTFGGGVSIQNVDGNAHVSGQFSVSGAALDALAWQRDERAVAAGTADLSGNFEMTGGSPAALVSSMTGGGVIAVHNGVARYTNPGTAGAIIRIADLGDPISQDQLRSDVEGQIDGDSFAFGDAGGAFAIAGGTVRFTGLGARSASLSAAGDATIDLNTMTLDSDWTLSFPVPDAAADAGDASIGLVFRGPLAAPSRIIDVVPFNAYLNERQASRMLDLIATEEADRAEHQRFVQQIAKIKDDEAAAERAREAALAAEQRREQAEVDAVAKVAGWHVEREIDSAAQRIASLARGASLAAAAATAARTAAQAVADDAAAKASAAQAADAARAQAVAADQAAAGQADKTGEQLTQAQATATATAVTAANSRAAADAAQKKADTAAATEVAARAAADKGTADAGDAAAALQSAKGALGAAQSAASEASDAAGTAADTVQAAAADLAAAKQAQATAAAANTSAQAALAAARSAADAASREAQRATDAATQNDAERARLSMVASSAANEAAVADNQRRAAETQYTVASSTAMSASAAVASAQGADPTGNSPDLAGKKATADLTQSQLQSAASDRAEAEAKAAEADDRASTAKAAAAAAVAEASTSQSAAASAEAAKDAALTGLADKQSSADAATRTLDDANAAVSAAEQKLAAAKSLANSADAKSVAATAAVDAATRAQASATTASSSFDTDGLAAALQKAANDHAAASAAAASAKQIAASDAAAALAAADALAGISSAHDAAVAAAQVAHAARLAAEAAAASAATAAADAKAKADAATAGADALAADAAVDAALVPVDDAPASAPAAAPSPSPPPPRPRPKAAANAPLSLVPAQ